MSRFRRSPDQYVREQDKSDPGYVQVQDMSRSRRSPLQDMSCAVYLRKRSTAVTENARFDRNPA